MDKVSQDFSFDCFSVEYGRFLVLCHDEGITFKNVENLYIHKPKHLFLNIETREDIAVLFKLTFGANLVSRPVPSLAEIRTQKKIEADKMFENLKSLTKDMHIKLLTDQIPKIKQDMYIVDYENWDFKKLDDEKNSF